MHFTETHYDGFLGFTGVRDDSGEHDGWGRDDPECVVMAGPNWVASAMTRYFRARLGVDLAARQIPVRDYNGVRWNPGGVGNSKGPGRGSGGHMTAAAKGYGGKGGPKGGKGKGKGGGDVTTAHGRGPYSREDPKGGGKGKDPSSGGKGKGKDKRAQSQGAKGGGKGSKSK